MGGKAKKCRKSEKVTFWAKIQKLAKKMVGNRYFGL